MLRSWEKIILDERSYQSITEWSKVFFEQEEALIKEQMIWFGAVFTDSNPAENLIQVLVEVYSNLDPKMDFCIDAGLKQQSEPLKYLMELKGIFNKHAGALDEMLSPGKMHRNH